MALAERGGEPEGPTGQRLSHQLDHGLQLFGGGRANGSRITHHRPADGGVPDQESGVDGQADVDAIEVLTE